MYTCLLQCLLAEPCFEGVNCTDKLYGYSCGDCLPGYSGSRVEGVDLEQAAEHPQVMMRGLICLINFFNNRYLCFLRNALTSMNARRLQMGDAVKCVPV